MASIPRLVDHNGRPVKRSSLRDDIANQTLMGVRTTWYDTVSSGLTPERLAAILVDVDSNGDHISYLTLAGEMEERDLHYASVLGTRRLAVAELPINIEAISDDAKDVEIADFVRGVMEDEDKVRPMLQEQLDALGKGYSVNEINWDRSGKQWIPKSYTWRDPRFFQFDRITGNVLSMRDDSDLVDGVPLEPFKFLVHTPKIRTGLIIRGGLARLAAVSYMCKGYGIKDWLAFAEVYGMPLRVGRYAAGATEAQKLELLTAVANIGTDAAAIIPENMLIEFIDGARSSQGVGESVFERLSNWLDRQVSKGVLGQTMTTDDGSSQSQATVHNEVRQDIKKHDALQLSSTLRRDLVKPLVDLNFGVQKKYPKLSLVIEIPEDLKVLADAITPFIDRGLRVEASVILDKFGIEEAEDDAEILQPKGKVNQIEPTGLESGDEDEDEDEDEKTEQQELTAKVMLGETLTEDQRGLLALLQNQPDLIDRLVAQEIEGWRYTMTPMLAPIIALAEAAETAADFAKGLDALAGNMDVDALVRSVATATLKTRGLGDTRDKV